MNELIRTRRKSKEPEVPIRLVDLLARYVQESLLDGKVTTEYKHEIAIRQFERTIRREAKLSDLTDANIAKMMTRLVDKGLARVTANGYRAKLVAIWSWACKKGWLTVWPTVPKFKEPKKLPVVWSKDDWTILWNSFEHQPGYIGGLPASLWWKVYHLIAWDTGERHSARLALLWSHFDDSNCTSGVFPAHTRKGGMYDQPFTLHPFTAALVRKVRSMGADRPTPWNLDYNYFFAYYRQLLISAGLPHDRKHQSHCLRRSFATHMIAKGLGRAEVSEALGHHDLRVLDAYVNSSMVPKIAPHEMLFRPWEGSPATEVEVPDAPKLLGPEGQVSP